MIMTFETHVDTQSDVAVEVTFALLSALGLRFNLCPLIASDRRRWLDLMRRENGIAFLWTRERWEQAYLIFVVREHFARLYAFSPHGFEAAARLTPDMVTALIDWLESSWFPGRRAQRDESDHEELPPAIEERPTIAELPSRIELARRAARPDMPEEQWEEDNPPAAEPGVEESDLPASDLDW